jgi:hypothetical protein
MFFSSFPKILYDIDNSKNVTLTVDFFRRLKLKSKVLNESFLYDLYDVIDGDTPESVAYKHFGDTNLHWVILITNNINDRYYDWPLTTEQFENYLTEKYTNPDGVHHYEINQSSGRTTSEGPSDYSYTIEVNSTTAGATTVTNREYEQRLQDQKRQIKLLNQGYLTQLIEEFEELIIQ